jgi:hypothetical protein
MQPKPPISEYSHIHKWEYITLRVVNEIVLSANDNQIGEIKVGMFKSEQQEGPALYEYLNVLGQGGWDVVGMSPITGGGDELKFHAYNVVLKRPLAG